MYREASFTVTAHGVGHKLREQLRCRVGHQQALKLFWDAVDCTAVILRVGGLNGRASKLAALLAPVVAQTTEATA